MAENKIPGRLSWLSNKLSLQRGHIAKLLLRLHDIVMRAGNNLGLHRKFLKLLEQVAYDRDKELNTINEIEEIERRHKELRRHNLLRKAGPAPSGQTTEFDAIKMPEPRRLGLLKLFGLLYLFAPRKRQDPASGPTVD